MGVGIGFVGFRGVGSEVVLVLCCCVCCWLVLISSQALDLGCFCWIWYDYNCHGVNWTDGPPVGLFDLLLFLLISLVYGDILQYLQNVDLLFNERQVFYGSNDV